MSRKGQKKYAGNGRGSSDYNERKLWTVIGTPQHRLQLKQIWASQKWTRHKSATEA